ncbi:MAG: LysR family transcriptional regulator [Proteobacteria bacterium]|nr:LysR family transcriptional regulator [Pseudomonadota bacterium]
MDWDKLRIFFIVAESGSFTHASARLEISQSAISRQISNLEDRMGFALFYRHARGLILTEQGELLFRTARDVFSELARVHARITENVKVSQGELKIAATVGFGTTWVAPRLYKFLSQYPEARITLRLSDDPVDLTIHESDIAISSLVTEDKNLMYQELLCRPLLIYSSRKYLLKFGVPLKPEDLDRHRLVVFNDQTMLPSDNVNWLLTLGTPPGVKREPYLSINNLYGIGKALEGGSGIACLPPYIAQKCHDLVQVLPEVDVPQVRFYFVYPRQLKDSQRIEQLWTFLSTEARQEEASSKETCK